MEAFILIIYVILFGVCLGLSIFFTNLGIEEKWKNGDTKFQVLVLSCLTVVSFILGITFYNNFVKETEPTTDSKNETEVVTIKTPQFYYLGVELVDVVTMYDAIDGVYCNPINCNVFGVVDGDEKYKGITYEYLSNEVFSFDVPYLLTMDSKGTNDVSDDEVVVIWEWVA